MKKLAWKFYQRIKKIRMKKLEKQNSVLLVRDYSADFLLAIRFSMLPIFQIFSLTIELLNHLGGYLKKSIFIIYILK